MIASDDRSGLFDLHGVSPPTKLHRVFRRTSVLSPNVDMMEALRLTRQGRLHEAMTVLRGAPTIADPPVPQRANDDGGTPVIDMVAPSPETGDAWTTPGFKAAPSSAGATRQRETPSGMPPGARFETHDFTNGFGSRSYKLYVPSRYDGEPLPLVVMLHGCTQTPDDFAAGTRMNESAEEQRFLVAYPSQSASANASRCWNWFNGSDQRRGQGEPSLVAGITQQIMNAFAVDAGRVYVAGLSAGGAAAATLGATYPDLYAAVGVHSGLPCGAARDLPSAFAAMRQGGQRVAGASGAPATTVPTIVFHGDADRTVNSVNGDNIISQAMPTANLKTTVLHGTSAGGVRYIRTVKEDAAARPMLEQWVLRGAGHAWSGGSAGASYTDPKGPDASREMVRFFLCHSTTK